MMFFLIFRKETEGIQAVLFEFVRIILLVRSNGSDFVLIALELGNAMAGSFEF